MKEIKKRTIAITKFWEARVDKDQEAMITSLLEPI